MIKSLKAVQKGFTIIELLIVIAIIGILAGLVLNNFQGANAKARDVQRKGDINALYGKLEEYYQANNNYPGQTFTQALFPGIDASALTDADSAAIQQTASTTATAASCTVANTNEYCYQATTCASATVSGAANTCTKYTLSAFQEAAGSTTYTKSSLN